ncbi:UPF0175 family protein [Endozoicomonas sp. 8E]|uniref:UPF0175 family protein n=1 Tax=Endozoicomonas sp. 8E TaxID=3035692 RepID=UPI002938EE96|nr:UPF0175 family protein [Endozoicomonas sp. 8E]WOG27510.1 UPF0175 family protein [Endozoicomonas sp. 8E]
MEMFGIRDLRERSGDFSRTAESGQLAMITKRDTPLMVGIPFTKKLLEQGIDLNLAIHLFQNRLFTLAKAARIASKSLTEFIHVLGTMGIDVVVYDPDELDRDLDSLSS